MPIFWRVPQGSGRHTLALGAAILLAGDCPEGQKIAAGCSPDVKCFGPSREKKQLTVDVIRAMKEDALFQIQTTCPSNAISSRRPTV